MTEPVRVAGHFRLLGPGGAELESADASFELEAEALVVHAGAQAPLRVDFADVDAFAERERALAVTLAGGEQVELSMLGRRQREASVQLGGAL